MLAIPPFPPPPVTFSPKLGPLAPLPFKPPLPAPDKCCPVYRRWGLGMCSGLVIARSVCQDPSCLLHVVILLFL